MLVRIGGVLAMTAAIVACAPADEPASIEDPAVETSMGPVAGDEPMGALQTAACEPVERMPVEGRESPYDSTMVALDGAELKVCYGRPSMRGREIFGGLVPYDTLWRTGANEPTTIHVPVAAEIAGLAVDPGSYSLYTVPGRDEWTIIVNRSTSQWGIEGQYTEEVRAQEVGRAQVAAEVLGTPREMFTITAESTGPGAAALILEWEETRVSVPVRAVG